MNFRATCMTQGASAVLFGAVLLVLPGPLLLLFGFGGPDVEVVGRIAGGMMLALGATLLSVRDVGPELRLQVCIGNGLCDVALTVLLALATRDHVANQLGYALTAIFLANALSWGIASRDRGALTRETG